MAKTLLPALAIVAAALFIYAPALNGTWLWDDNSLVASNVRLHTLAGLGKIWFAAPTTDYWPLTWTLLWIEWHLWGDAPLGYHLVSLALHIASAFLLWRVLNRLGLRRGWIGGLLFAVHPLAVESVAWISEIKNTLSLLLFLLAFDAWLDADEGQTSASARSVAFYLLAMLAKTSTVMLPLVLLLYCWWKRGRVTRGELLRMAPFFAIALVLGAITIHFQNHAHPLQPVEPTGLANCVIVAGIALCFYLGKFLLPLGLATIYPAWPLDPPSLIDVLALPAIAALLILLGLAPKTWSRHALFGFAFFVLTIAPVMGLIPMAYLEFSPVADHFAYLPMIGLVALIAAAFDRLVTRTPSVVPLAMLGCLVVALGVASRAYAARYVRPLEFWNSTLATNPLAWPAYTGVGNALIEEGRASQALGPLRQAVKLKPDFEQGHYDLANAELILANFSDAIGEYEIALKLDPRDANAHYNLANALLLQPGRAGDAIAEYEQALRLIPDSAEIRGNYAQALMRAGRTAEALAQFRQAAQLDPGSAVAAYNLGVACEQTGDAANAVIEYQRALELQPGFTSAQQRLARLQAKK